MITNCVEHPFAVADASCIKYVAVAVCLHHIAVADML